MESYLPTPCVKLLLDPPNTFFKHPPHPCPPKEHIWGHQFDSCDESTCDTYCEGPRGPAGPTGSIGPTGPRGFGVQGATGSTGSTGLMGSIGPTGLAGTPGGPTGPTGPRGEFGMGATGEMGPTGPAGPTGSNGPSGIMGPTGERGTPGHVPCIGELLPYCSTLLNVNIVRVNFMTDCKHCAETQAWNLQPAITGLTLEFSRYIIKPHFFEALLQVIDSNGNPLIRITRGVCSNSPLLNHISFFFAEPLNPRSIFRFQFQLNVAVTQHFRSSETFGFCAQTLFGPCSIPPKVYIQDRTCTPMHRSVTGAITAAGTASHLATKFHLWRLVDVCAKWSPSSAAAAAAARQLGRDQQGMQVVENKGWWPTMLTSRYWVG